MSTYQLCCSKFAFHDQRFHNYFGHFFLASCTLQILTIVIRYNFILALRTRLAQRIFFDIHLL